MSPSCINLESDLNLRFRDPCLNELNIQYSLQNAKTSQIWQALSNVFRPHTTGYVLWIHAAGEICIWICAQYIYCLETFVNLKLSGRPGFIERTSTNISCARSDLLRKFAETNNISACFSFLSFLFHSTIFRYWSQPCVASWPFSLFLLSLSGDSRRWKCEGLENIVKTKNVS